MLFCSMDLPNECKKEKETNIEAFCRVIDLFMGEYDIQAQPFSYAALGQWVMKNEKRFKKGCFPCAWIEDENGNITEYFIFYKKGNDKILRHDYF